MVRRKISGVALSANEAKIVIRGIKDEPGRVGAIFAPLGSANIDVSMIVQDMAKEGGADVTFTVDQSDLPLTMTLLKDAREAIGYSEIESDTDVVRVSVIGLNMERNIGLAQTMFDALGKEGINIQAISTSEVKISVLVSNENAERAVRALHSAFVLDQK